MTAIVTAPTRTADSGRGSGRRTRTRWYRVVTARAVEGQTVIDGFNLEVPNTYLGLGTRDRIDAAADDRGEEVIDAWPIARPIAA